MKLYVPKELEPTITQMVNELYSSDILKDDGVEAKSTLIVRVLEEVNGFKIAESIKRIKKESKNYTAKAINMVDVFCNKTGHLKPILIYRKKNYTEIYLSPFYVLGYVLKPFSTMQRLKEYYNAFEREAPAQQPKPPEKKEQPPKKSLDDLRTERSTLYNEIKEVEGKSDKLSSNERYIILKDKRERLANLSREILDLMG